MSRLNPLMAAKIAMRDGRSWISMPLAHWIISPFSGPFLVSWPRSGSTWLRTMLTHIMIDGYDSNPEVFNQFIPGTSLTRVINVREINPISLRSTHAMYHRSIAKAVYLVRDIRKALPSLYRYTTTRIGENLQPHDWLRFYHKGLYGPRWEQHVCSWLEKGKSNLADQILVIKYEDMQLDPVKVLENVATFLDIDFCAENLDRAVLLSRPEVMRKWEEKQLGTIQDANASFYRGGLVDEWRSLFTKEDREDILSRAEYGLLLAGYV